MDRVESAHVAVEKLIELYTASCELARDALTSGDYARYKDVYYPKLSVEIGQWVPVDRSEPFGYVDEAGTYSAVLSRPDLMAPE